MDIQFAAQLGYTIKLLGIIKTAERKPAGAGRRRVRASRSPCIPTLIPNSHVLASVNDVFNAVFVRGDVVGDTLFYGRGAGKDATASAVLSDLADAALDLKFGTKHRVPPFVPHERERRGDAHRRGRFRDITCGSTWWTCRACWRGLPPIFGEPNIGISSVIQPEGHEGASVPLILMLHDAPNGGGRAGAWDRSARCPWSKAQPVMLRVEDFP